MQPFECLSGLAVKKVIVRKKITGWVDGLMPKQLLMFVKTQSFWQVSKDTLNQLSGDINSISVASKVNTSPALQRLLYKSLVLQAQPPVVEPEGSDETGLHRARLLPELVPADR